MVGHQVLVLSIGVRVPVPQSVKYNVSMRVPRSLAFKNTSNAFYLVPFVAALYSNLLLTQILVFAVVIFGLLYHLSHEKRFLLPDAIAAYSLILSNLWLCYLGDFQAPYFWIALLFVFLASFYHYYLQRIGEYSLNHGMWHMYGALITLFCIFTVTL